MSGSSEASGRPLAATLSEGNTVQLPGPSDNNHRDTSLSSNEAVHIPKSINSHRRVETKKQASPGPHTGSSRSQERLSTSPTMASQLPPVHYTRTGRISKAKKGLKVHNCENCGRSYTRAEHLRRHQKNHAQEAALICEFPGCNKPFYRIDLLHRHQERHNETGKDARQDSICSSAASPEMPQTPIPCVPSTMAPSTLPSEAPYYMPQPMSPVNEPTHIPRYIQQPFRTPQLPLPPRTPKLSSGFSNIVRSSPTSACTPNQTKHREPYSARHSVSHGIAIESLTPSLGWSEPYSQSPGYTSSSGYNSPIPGSGDLTNMFANPPYGPGSNRTRTSSNASFIEHWSFASRSPTSTTPYAWSSDKTPIAPTLAFVGTSFPMSNIPIPTTMDMSGYEHYVPKTVLQRDEEEGVILFGEQQYGMGPITHTYPLEQYLDNYWRLFHPTFPVVHRYTFEGVTASPMLHAAMIAIGGQYSNESSVRRKSRILHDRCLKLLERREQNQHLMGEDVRLCDYQAVLLVEVLSQYRSRRAAKMLSSRFITTYQKAHECSGSVSNQLSDLSTGINPENWTRWIELASWQRLLLCCYILETQQALLLAREPLPSIISEAGHDLPFPSHMHTWDAPSAAAWAFALQQYPQFHRCIYEVSVETTVTALDAFQSSLVISANYNRFEATQPYVSAPTLLDIESLLEPSSATRCKLLTAKLVQVVPIRALLAISGESWILSEKVATPQDLSRLKTTLKTWLSQLWTPADVHHTAAKQALRLSIEILEQAMKEQQGNVTLEMGNGMGIFFAGLVMWAITASGTARVNNLQRASMRPGSQGQAFPQMSVTSSPQTAGQDTSIVESNAVLSHRQITINAITFLSNVSLDYGSTESASHLPVTIGRCQSGCFSLMMWVKLRLAGVPLNEQDGARHGGEGELLEGILTSIEKTLKRGWNGWCL